MMFKSFRSNVFETLAVIGSLLIGVASYAADSTVTNLPAASTLDGTELLLGVQSGASKKITGNQVKTLIGTTVTTSCGITGGTISPGQTGTIKGAPSARAVNTTSDTVLAADCGAFITYTNASATAITLPQATGSFTAGFFTTIINEGAGVVTITPTTSTIDGQASLTLAQYSGVDIFSDGTNYFTMRGRATTASVVDFQIFTSGATWTPPAGNFAEVYIYGCGGGGQGGGGAAL